MYNNYVMYFFIVSLIFVLSFRRKKKLDSVEQGGGNGETTDMEVVYIAPSIPVTSLMKVFYFLAYTYMVYSVFFLIYGEAAEQWGGFLAVPNSANDKSLCFLAFKFFVILEAIHFFRIYAYLHFLEEPLSPLHIDFIKPITQHKNAANWLLGENFIRLIIMVFVSLKFVGYMFQQRDAFREFAYYLLFFYAILIVWDIIICIAAKKDLLFETFFAENSFMVVGLIVFINSLPRAVEKTDRFENVTIVLGEGNYTVAMWCLFFMCAGVLISTFIKPIYIALKKRFDLKKEGGAIRPATLRSLLYNEIRLYFDLINDILDSIIYPQYGRALRKCTVPMYREGGNGPPPQLCDGEKCFYQRYESPLFVDADNSVDKSVKSD